MKKELSSNELELMEAIWDFNRPVTSLDLAPKIKKSQNGYLQNLLKSLEKKGLIECTDILQSGRRFVKQYQYRMTKEEYAAKILAPLHLSRNAFPEIALALVKEIPDEHYEECIQELKEIIHILETKRQKES